MPSKQRIAFVANTSWSIYKFRLELLQALIHKGYEVYVLAPRDGYTDVLAKIEGLYFVELKKFKSKSVSFKDDFALYRELRSHYTVIRPAFIFHYTIKANIYGSIAAAHAGCNAIAVITGLGYMFTGKKIFKFIASLLYRYALGKTCEVWFLNRDDQQSFIESGLVPGQKTFLLPGEGVNANRFYPSPYHDNESPVSFLFIGRLIAHKGIYEFVAAARQLREKNVHARFNVLGFFDEESAVAVPRTQLAQWQNEGSIVYLGETDNVVPFIAAADCVVLPSYREGMPLSLLEGASMCKALIATNVAGCRSVVKNGVNGFLCEARNAGDLAKTMEQYCSMTANQKTALGLAGRQLVVDAFEQEIVIGIYLDKLEKLISR